MTKLNRFWTVLIFLLVFAFQLAACGDDSQPTPITYTPGCSVSNLIDDINEANNDPEPAVINLEPNCPYILTEADNSKPLNNQTLHSGLPIITSEITIDGNNAVIDIQGASPAFFGHFLVEPDGDLALYDLTLENGARLWGGAVFVYEGDFFASNTNFLNNSVYPADNNIVGLGGAIYNDSGRVRIIENSLFQGNHAGETTASGDNLGGAIYNKNGRLTVVNSTFDLNFAAGSGGAIFSGRDVFDESGGLVLIDDSSFISNTALQDGGAIYLINETNGVLITTSDFSENGADDSGGAIYSEASDLTANLDTFENNTAALGGAIFSKRLTEGSLSSYKSKQSEFTRNTASEIGGAIFSENSDITLESSLFQWNTASSCGAIRNGGHPGLDVVADYMENLPRIASNGLITDSYFNFNEATLAHGGAICHLMGDLSIQGTTFAGNQAVSFGGALLILDEVELSGLSVLNNSAKRGGGAAVGYPEQYYTACVTSGQYIIPTYLSFNTSISNSSFSANQASCRGGGLWAHHGGRVAITKSTFSSNTSDFTGGGINQWEGDLYITNSTFSGNIAVKGGGLYARGTLISNPILEIKHSTFAKNTATETSGDEYNRRWGGGGLNVGGSVKIENSLITQNTSIDCQLDNGQYSSWSLSGIVDSDGHCGAFLTEPNPGIGPLSYNGGSTATHALLSTSPLIDILPDCALLSDDQRGVSRPQPQAGNCDPGAYEFDPTNPPPPRPDPEISSSSSTRCALFEEMDFSLVLFSIPRETTDLTLNLNMAGGVPGLELEIPDDPGPWIYSALLGDTESVECSFLGYEGSLFCNFVLPATAIGSTQDLSVYLNGCDDPIFSQPRVSILEPQLPPTTCKKGFDEASCIADGGTFYKLTDELTLCVCP